MKCNYCQTELENNTYPGGVLNKEQWKAIKAGDRFCPNSKCPGIKKVREKKGPGKIGIGPSPKKEMLVFFTN